MSAATRRRSVLAASRRAARRRRWTLATAAVVALGLIGTVGWVLIRPGSSAAGSQPPQSALGAGTRMGPVELLTGDLDRLREFYTKGVGLSPISVDDREVTLGRDDVPLLRLVRADAPADDPRQAGLYHSAFLFPDEPALARALLDTATAAPGAFQGASDHRVSQAFYFADPDGNGVELYVDRPRDQWRWENGRVVMGSTAIDPNAFIDTHLDRGATGPATGLTMGHVHLRGGDLAQAERFYADALGFAVTARTDGALFLAADGYHHHLAVNVWSSAGAGARPDSLGLRTVAVHVAGLGELDALEQRLTSAGVDYQRADASIVVRDPWGTQVAVRVPTPGVA
ncbi:VOC family protein [Micromonospora zingiberis]|uniref:VOC family protein n=1 Tax=Micromonospora zingiberis TaxID=2053011 RepID=A0A4R0GJB4_9ACTN|nr:VOC family protein [Micromonospora zingiberis]TCB96867.1 VOC family protein [Micromonospora zingiberis]